MNEHHEYQISTRQHSDDTLKTYQIGKACEYSRLESHLVEAGYELEEIKAAKVWIPEGLFTYPYRDKSGHVTRFNTKNPFKVTNNDGQIIKGFSTGAKANYNSQRLYTDFVIACEGENDLLSLVEAGAKSVIATGGTPSKEQIDGLRIFEKIYCMFDNDDAGDVDMAKINDLLPDIQVFKIEYDRSFKDP